MTRQVHKVAIVVMCEAEGVDARDAAVGAQVALNRLIYNNKQDDKQEQVGSISGARCPECGVSWPLDLGEWEGGVDANGNIRRHVSCERWSPEEIDDWDEEENGPRPAACEGSGKPPRRPNEPIIGFDRASDGLPIYARVHEVMDAGMAAGNGYLWLQPTWKAFR